MQDRERIREIYDRQVDRAYRTALVFMKNPQDAEDIVQSVFLTLIEKDMHFDSPEHEKAWFIVTTRNRCKDMLKSYWRQHVDLKDEEADMGGLLKADAAADGGYDIESAKEILMSLPEGQREIILLHYYEGYTIKEVAEMIGVKESAVRSAISSVKRAIAKMTIK